MTKFYCGLVGKAFVLLLVVLVCVPSTAAALSTDQTKALNDGIYYFNISVDNCGNATGASLGGNSTPTASVGAFVDKYGQMAYQNSINTGVPYEFTLGQAIVESGYGGSALSSQYFNFFGIKADSSWTGATVSFPTEEYVNGSYVQVNALFRAYPNAGAGFADHDAFLRDNSRYASAFQYSNDPIKFLDAVAAAGYATDPSYASTVGAVIQQVQSYIASKNLWPPSSQVTYNVTSTPTSTSGSLASSTQSCSCSSTGSTVTALSSANVPAPYADIFTQAGTKYGVAPAFIAAIFYAGEHGSSWPTPPAPYGSGAPWTTSPTGAQGPFQFEPATWGKYGVDGNGDGKVDVQDLTDAAFGAANYFANGLNVANTTDEQKLRQAAANYNGSGNPDSTYAIDVWNAYLQFNSGNSTSGAGCSGSTAAVAYRNPLRDVKSLRPRRIDQGVDYAGEGPVYALGKGTILNLTNSGWDFGGYDAFISEKLDEGPAAGDVVYVAEACLPMVQIGQQVDSNTTICNMINPTGTGIETGWATPTGNGTPLAQLYGGNGSTVTTVGINYNNLLVSLGAPSGLYQGATIGSPLPANWPTW